MAEKDNRDFARQAIAAINAHNIESYLQHIDDSYVAESETLPGPVHGREGARQMLQTMFQAFPDLHLEVEQLLASGDHVISRVLLTGTQKGNFAGIAPTNKKVSWHACNFVELKNGKAIKSRIYADNVSLFRQLGVIATPKATSA
jgi:steroid delta-isomerase-like uncharacterized protein